MTKEPEYHVGCGLFGIYAGTLMKPKKDGVIMWRKKSDVTEEAIHAVMQYFKQTMDGHDKTAASASYEFADGRTLTVNFTITQPDNKDGD